MHALPLRARLVRRAVVCRARSTRRGCGCSPRQGAAQLNLGLDHLFGPVRDMGHIAPVPLGGCADNLNRMALPLFRNLGSAGSFGVQLDRFDLIGGADRLRFPDASTIVVDRS